MYKLFTRQGSKLRQWVCEVDGADVVVTHGQVGGKQTTKRYTAEAKNLGRSNFTTPEQQSVLEMEAKVALQLKRGYYKTEQEAMLHVEFTPQKAHSSNDYAHKIVFPCYIECKLDGMRCMLDASGNALSKQGEPLEFPKHWDGVAEIAERYGGLDAEVYAGLKNNGGLSLQSIISAFRKANKDTPKLKLYVYDIPLPGATMVERVELLTALDIEVKNNGISFIEVVLPAVVHNFEQIEAYTSKMIALGYEGAMVRNFKGVYEFGKRSYDLLKVKKRLDAEALVLSSRIDKNGDGVLTVEAVNGKQSGVQFDCLMKKDSDPVMNYRKYENSLLLIGQYITYEYEDVGDDTAEARGKPQKPCGVAIREVLSNGEPRY